MLRSDLIRPTFRLKILAALIGTVAPLLLVTLLVVQREADRQVDAVVAGTVERAGDVFERIEKQRQQQLNLLGLRFANSNRWGAALQQALEGDTAMFVLHAKYELEFAGFPNALAAATGLGGEPLVAIVNGTALPDPSVAISSEAIDRVFKGDTSVFGYHQLGNALFSIHPIILNLVEYPVGILLLGFAIDHQTASSLGQVLGADVCFKVKDRCVATSTGTPGRRFATVSRALDPANPTGPQVELRIPLDDVVRPFASILRAIRLIGLAVLFLAIIVALVLSRGLAEPVRALLAATARVARGEYETHVPVTSKDEIGQLAGAFNEMTHGLLLKEKYRGVLDKVVSRDVADEMLKGEIQLGGEIREVTTFFADVRGFTRMTEGMAPHDVITMLNEVMESAEAAIVAEGGVVDKYVGDEIMALFGAPVARGDDALRAVRAAIRMQSEAKIKLGIGINTGEVVAGNMGSARRLNYTVLGAPVNLAARLCSEAQPGQILISETTLDRVGDRVQVSALGERNIKGFSKPIRVFEVRALLIAAMCTLSAVPAFAQRTIELGPLQVQPWARVDVQGFVPDSAPAFLIAETDPFVSGRASAFFDIFAGDRLYGFAELRLDRGDAPSNGDLEFRIEQAFVRITPTLRIDASLQAGRFVNPFGGYPQRHHSESDPLIRPPLMYDYRTVISDSTVAAARDGFLNWRNDPARFRPVGLPPIWAAPYQLGAMLLGSFGRVNYRLAIMNGAPSAEPELWNQWPDAAEVSYVAHLGVQVTPELRLGASFDRGAYMMPAARAALPAGTSIVDFKQTLIGLEGSWSLGFVELRGEWIHDAWQVPIVPDEDAIDMSYYLESKVKLAPGLFVSGRYGALLFNELTRSNGARQQWDYDTRRLQLGAGYRVSEPFEVRAELMINNSEGPLDPRDNLFAIQAAWTIK